MDKQQLDIDINLSETNRTLSPLNIPSFNSATFNSKHDNIIFDIKILKSPVETLKIKISQNKKIIYQQTLDASKLLVGNHKWAWNCYNNQGIYDSRMLKQYPIDVELLATLGSYKKTKTIIIDGMHAEQDWVDIIINKNSRQIEIELRTNIIDGGNNGVSEPPPSEVQESPVFNHYKATDIRKKKHVRLKSFNDLKALLLTYFRAHWSRKIVAPNGLEYNVIVKPISTKINSMDDIAIEYNTNRDWLRSSNPGSVRGICSLIGNLIPERIAYNTGWIKYTNRWGYIRSIEADKSFGETAAHELGHEILSAYGGDTYSYSHKNSSYIISQTAKKITDGGIKYPNSGEIDLMKYYNGKKPSNFYSRVYASEQDVKSLIWLSKITFK